MTLDLDRPSPFAAMESMMDENVSVPRALLSLCADLLAECDKHVPISGTNFDDDMDLARKQLRLLINSTAPASQPSSVGEEATDQDLRSACAHINRPVNGGYIRKQFADCGLVVIRRKDKP